MKNPADSNQFLFHALHRAHHNAILSALNARGLADVGQPMILFILDNSCEVGEVPAQKDLADRLHVSPATIAISLKSLERMGYISRATDVHDGRRKQVTITEKGRQAVRGCFEVFDQVDAQMHKGLTPDEIERLMVYERRMLENLRQIGGDKEQMTPPPPFLQERL